MIAQKDLDMKKKVLQINQEDKDRIREELNETKEALSRSRQLRKSFQDIADKKIGEKNTIEQMAEMVFNLISKELREFVERNGMQGGFNNMGKKYEDLSEEWKDEYRVMATRIVSESPQ